MVSVRGVSYSTYLSCTSRYLSLLCLGWLSFTERLPDPDASFELFDTCPAISVITTAVSVASRDSRCW